MIPFPHPYSLFIPQPIHSFIHIQLRFWEVANRPHHQPTGLIPSSSFPSHLIKFIKIN
jgi:hypothetical protein